MKTHGNHSHGHGLGGCSMGAFGRTPLYDDEKTNDTNGKRMAIISMMMDMVVVALGRVWNPPVRMTLGSRNPANNRLQLERF